MQDSKGTNKECSCGHKSEMLLYNQKEIFN